MMTPPIDKRTTLVIGLGKSGQAASLMLARQGLHVRASDRVAEKDLACAPMLRAAGIDVICGDQPASLADGVDMVVVSPGVPATHPILVRAASHGTPIYSELELAWQLLRGRARFIAVTGSNGKSTTVTLTGHLLNQGSARSWVGGNLGTPLATLAMQDEIPEWVVVEVSSFQLEWVDTFAPDVSAILNLSPNHLDRHASMQDYAAQKAKIWRNLGATASRVFNRDDIHSRDLAHSQEGRHLSFGAGPIPAAGGARFYEDKVEVHLPPYQPISYSLQNYGLLGAHNRANAAAACLMASIAGASPDEIQQGLATYRALPHRLESLGSSAGVTYINDSKATTTEALSRSIEAVRTPLVLICGGRDKGGDFVGLRAQVTDRLQHVFVIGEATPTIMKAWQNCAPLQACATLRDAVQGAARVASAGDTVLFSPACASFDMFENFEDRGEQFKALVRTLPGFQGVGS